MSGTCGAFYLFGELSDLSKLKAFANDEVNVTEKFKFVLGSVENIVGKRRKCRFPAFSPLSTMFSKVFFFRVFKDQDCVVKSSLKC